MEKETLQIAKKIFKRIATDYPSLETTIQEGSQVELEMVIPKQKGLKFPIHLNLQNNDELHLQAGNCFWLEWFPCTNPERVEQFVDAVNGLISGKYRILEHYRGKRAIKAEFQIPDGETWNTIGTWSTLSFPFPMRKEQKVVSNA